MMEILERRVNLTPHSTPLPRFNSVLGQSRSRGGAVDHREYVVFDQVQAVPIAVVTYRHAPGCACSRCSCP